MKNSKNVAGDDQKMSNLANFFAKKMVRGDCVNSEIVRLEMKIAMLKDMKDIAKIFDPHVVEKKRINIGNLFIGNCD